MKNTILRKFRKNKSGQAVLMVILVTMFVVMMGSSALFSSYNGYLVQLVERDGLDTFYTAEDKLTQVKAIVQDFSSDALQTSYTKVMSEYAFWLSQGLSEEEVQEEAQKTFTSYFLDELNKLFVDDSGESYEFITSGSAGTSVSSSGTNFTSSNEKLFYFDDNAKVADGDFYVVMNTTLSGAPTTTTERVTTSSGIFDTTILQALAGLDDCTITTANGESDGSTTGTFLLESSVSGDRLVMKDVMISYKDENGYQSYIVTDIIIEMPDFVHNGTSTIAYYEPGVEGVTPLDNASSIAKLWVKTGGWTGDGLLVEGDMYAGTFNTYSQSTNADFSHGNGRLITHTEKPYDSFDNFETGTIQSYLTGFEIYDGTKFFTSADSEIWVSEINVHGGGDLVLQGSLQATQNAINVAGDLRVSGGTSSNTTSLTLTGDYFGFGHGGKPETDSAIIIDGNNVDVYMEFNSEHENWNADFSDRRANQLNTLRIAGLNYLTGREGVSNAEYAMGQSMATLFDQVAYLIPADALIGVSSNPTASASVPKVDLSYELWAGTTIGDFCPTDKPVVIKNNYITGETASYYFFNFRDTTRVDFDEEDPLTDEEVARSNDYFRGYVSAYGQAFVDRNSEFVTMAAISEQFFELVAKGNVYYNANQEGFVISGNDTGHELVIPTEVKISAGTWYFDHNETKTFRNEINEIYETEKYYISLQNQANERQRQFETASITLHPDYLEPGSWNNVEDINRLQDIVIRGDDDTITTDDELIFKRLKLVSNPDADPATDTADNVPEGTVVSSYADLIASDKPLTGILTQNYLTRWDVDRAHENVAGGWDLVDNPYDFYVEQALLTIDSVRSVETGNLQYESWSQRYLYFRDNHGDVIGAYSGGGYNQEVGNLPFASSAFGDITRDNLNLIVAFSGLNLQWKDGHDVLTYEGLAMSNVGIALESPIFSNGAGFQDALDATCQIYLKSFAGSPYSMNRTSDQTIEDWVSLQTDKAAIELQKEYRRGSTYSSVVDSAGVEWLTLDVPFSAYFRNLDYISTPGNSGSETVGSTKDEAFVNWDSEDLVYFENWEKY